MAEAGGGRLKSSLAVAGVEGSRATAPRRGQRDEDLDVAAAPCYSTRLLLLLVSLTPPLVSSKGQLNRFPRGHKSEQNMGEEPRRWWAVACDGGLG